MTPRFPRIVSASLHVLKWVHHLPYIRKWYHCLAFFPCWRHGNHSRFVFLNPWCNYFSVTVEGTSIKVMYFNWFIGLSPPLDCKPFPEDKNPSYCQCLVPVLEANGKTEWPHEQTNGCTLLRNCFPICICLFVLTYWGRINRGYRDNLKEDFYIKIGEMKGTFYR